MHGSATRSMKRRSAKGTAADDEAKHVIVAVGACDELGTHGSLLHEFKHDPFNPVTGKSREGPQMIPDDPDAVIDLISAAGQTLSAEITMFPVKT